MNHVTLKSANLIWLIDEEIILVHGNETYPLNMHGLELIPNELFLETF